MLRDPNATVEAITRWIRSYFDGACPKGRAVVGISGGKDSSCVATLCVRALGRDRVLGVLMPNGVQSDIDDARRVVSTLGIAGVTMNIGRTVSAALDMFEDSAELSSVTGLDGLSRDGRINLPARIRMATLYAIAQSLPHGGLVMNTCNRSEDYVGYSTKYGDAAGDLAPISGLVVEEVRQVGRALGLPADLVGKPPSDGLSGMDDEQKLGFSYEVLDRYILTGACADEATRRRIDVMHVRNLHKLQTIPAYEVAAGERVAGDEA
ncbi:NAD(+) synthase [bacterium]|nr:NAD(+) synthase [bacterium]